MGVSSDLLAKSGTGPEAYRPLWAVAAGLFAIAEAMARNSAPLGKDNGGAQTPPEEFVALCDQIGEKLDRLADTFRSQA